MINKVTGAKVDKYFSDSIPAMSVAIEKKAGDPLQRILCQANKLENRKEFFLRGFMSRQFHLNQLTHSINQKQAKDNKANHHIPQPVEMLERTGFRLLHHHESGEHGCETSCHLLERRINTHIRTAIVGFRYSTIQCGRRNHATHDPQEAHDMGEGDDPGRYSGKIVI